MSAIPTWHERAMAHPDHQNGMISEDMIRARMCEEIEDLRAEVERLRAEIKQLYNAGGMTRAALGSWAGDAEPTHKRVAAVVAEVEKLRAQIALRVPEVKP